MTVVVAYAVLVVIGVAVLWCAFTAVGTERPLDVRTNILIVVVGALLGFMGGALATPLDAEEKATFSEVGKVVAAVLGGWGLAKVDPIVTKVFAEGAAILALARALMFLGALLTSGLVVYFTRAYVLGS